MVYLRWNKNNKRKDRIYNEKTSLVAGFVLGVGVLFTSRCVLNSGRVRKWSLGQEPKRWSVILQMRWSWEVKIEWWRVFWRNRNQGNRSESQRCCLVWNELWKCWLGSHSLLVNHVKIVNVEAFKHKDKEYKTLLSLKYQLFNEDSKDKKSNLTKPIWCWMMARKLKRKYLWTI